MERPVLAGNGISRRSLLVGLLAAGAAAFLSACTRALTDQTRAAVEPLAPTPSCGEQTPSNPEGPFYAPQSPRRRVLAEPGMAGVPLVVTGQVVTTRCQPIPGAMLDFWQADESGNYDNEASRLRGHQLAGPDGEYRLETIVPAAYQAGSAVRTPHIHVKVAARNRPILTTQLYFPQQALNDEDFLFNEALLMDVHESAEGQVAAFTFVIT